MRCVVTTLDDLWNDRAVAQTILTAYRRKLARMKPTDFDTERDYRAEVARIEELAERSEVILTDNSECIVEAWKASRVKPSDIPQHWGGAT